MSSGTKIHGNGDFFPLQKLLLCFLGIFLLLKSNLNNNNIVVIIIMTFWMPHGNPRAHFTIDHDTAGLCASHIPQALQKNNSVG